MICPDSAPSTCLPVLLSCLPGLSTFRPDRFLYPHDLSIFHHARLHCPHVRWFPSPPHADASLLCLEPNEKQKRSSISSPMPLSTLALTHRKLPPRRRQASTAIFTSPPMA